jgi:hypothetical protein
MGIVTGCEPPQDKNLVVTAPGWEPSIYNKHTLWCMFIMNIGSEEVRYRIFESVLNKELILV